MLYRDTRSLWLIVCQLLFRAVMVESGFHETPSNSLAVVGQQMKLKCWTDPGVTTHWYFSQRNERQFSLVYNGQSLSPDFVSRFHVDNSAGIGHHDLVLNNVTLTDAGIYECEELSSDTADRAIPVSSTAQLVVLESNPYCNTNVSTKYGGIEEFYYVALRCAVNYSGHWTPSMHWSKGKQALKESPIVIHSNISYTVHHLSSVIIFQVSAEFNGVVITCDTKLSEVSMKVHFTNATNTPNNSFHWNTTLNVQFGARNATITPLKEKYDLTDVLKCAADGNPNPTYTWTDVGTKETIGIGPQLPLSTTKMGDNKRYTIECNAQNDVAGDIRLSSININVTVAETWQIPFGYIIAAGVSVCFTLTMVFIFRFVGKKLPSRNSRDKTNVSEEAPQSLSPDYDSISVATINESPSTSTMTDTHAIRSPTEDAPEAYCTLMERPAIIHQPTVYNSLEAGSIRFDLPNRVSMSPPVYVNISIV